MRQLSIGIILGVLVTCGVGALALVATDLDLTSEPDRVLVPDVTDLTKRQAVKALEIAGLRSTFDVPKGDRLFGTVGTQIPASGVRVDPGTEVLLFSG
jgi:beta-lactam-binding protein with PASTA domain